VHERTRAVAALKKSATATGVGAICAIQRATRLQRRRTTQQALLIIYRRIGLQLVEAAAIVLLPGLFSESPHSGL